MRARLHVLASLSILLASTGATTAATIIVKADGTGDQPDIATAVGAAVGGDVVLLEPGIYTGAGNRGVTVDKNITITSSGGARVTIIDCQSTGWGFKIVSAGSGAVLSKLTIRHALGGIQSVNQGAVMIIEDNVIEDGPQAAMRVFGCPSATIRRNLIQNNNTGSPGAGLLIVNSSATIEDNVFRNNTGGTGGAIDCEAIPAGRTILFDNNIFCGNSGTLGGALFLLSIDPGASVTVSNNTLIENSASNQGGGIWLQNATVSVSNTIVAFSSAGGGVFAGNSAGSTFTCCDVFGNVGGNGDNLVGVIDGGNNISLDPLFVGAPSSCDVTLQPASPCTAANSPCGSRIGANIVFGAHHFEIAYPDAGGVDPGNRSKLVSQWSTVRVTAADILGNTVETYTGTASVSAKGHDAGGEVDWSLSAGGGVFLDAGPGNDTATYTFDPADNGVADLQIRNDRQDFIDPEVADQADITVTDDDSEEYVAFTQSGNILEGPLDVNNIAFGAGLAAFSTSVPTPASLTTISYFRSAAGGFLGDPTVTVVPYKDTSALGVTPPPNFKMMYSALALEAPYPYCNGYDITIPNYPPAPPPAALIITQSFDDAVLSDLDEGNIQLHHWNGATWDILPATVNTAANIIWTIATGLPQLSPFFVTQPLDENIYTATVEIEPDTLNIAGTYGWVTGYIELGGGLDVNDIDLATVTLNPTEIDVAPGAGTGGGVAVADPGHFVIGDHDNDTTPDAEVRFDRETVVSMFTDANPTEEFIIRGFMDDGFSFFKDYTTIVTIDDLSAASATPAVSFSLGQNYPNPFNPTTTIAFTLRERMRTTLTVYDVEGRLVKVLVDETMGAGLQEVAWDGVDASGNRVGSGVYFYHLNAGNKVLTKKMVLLK